MKLWLIFMVVWIAFGVWLAIWFADSAGSDTAFGTHEGTPSFWLFALFIFGGGFILGRNSVRNAA